MATPLFGPKSSYPTPSGRLGIGGSSIAAEDDPFSLIANRAKWNQQAMVDHTPMYTTTMPLIVGGKRIPTAGGSYGKIADKFGNGFAQHIAVSADSPAAQDMSLMADKIGGSATQGVHVGHFMGPNAVQDYRQTHGLPPDGTPLPEKRKLAGSK